MREALTLLVGELASVSQRIEAIEKRLVALHRSNEVSRRLASIPGIGPITAMAIADTVPTRRCSDRAVSLPLGSGLLPKATQAGARID